MFPGSFAQPGAAQLARVMVESLAEFLDESPIQIMKHLSRRVAGDAGMVEISHRLPDSDDLVPFSFPGFCCHTEHFLPPGAFESREKGHSSLPSSDAPKGSLLVVVQGHTVEHDGGYQAGTPRG